MHHFMWVRQVAREYGKVPKSRLAKEGSEVVTDCNRLKLTVADGKQRITDVVSAETLPCNCNKVELRDARESVHSQDFNYGEFAGIKRSGGFQ